MTNLTIALDEAVVKNARIRAVSEGTSVSAKVREFLAQYAQGDTSQVAGQGFLDLARESRVNSQGVRWTRDDAYDRSYPGSANSAKP
jgi:plasmid stability protein